ncbi:MAG: hypothetical protein ABIY70_21110 [Capsulimonas sp.]|uniref:hypothetical protein n=1 Tax=Capsulimonas sp. TaxID=2494211 RepID=UPI0032656EE4
MHTRFFHSQLFFSVSLCGMLSFGGACAQVPLAAVRPTLAASLAHAAPPGTRLALSVAAETVTLPEGASAPSREPSVGEVSRAYGRTTHEFGSVVAVAPPTMVILNTAPGEPNIYAGLPVTDAFTLLASSLTDEQWKQLTSEQGLGIQGFDAQQKQMFAALLSADGKLVIRPKYANGEKWDDHDKRDMTAQLPQVHLRMSQTIALNIPPKEDPNSEYMDAEIPPPAGSPRQYEVADRHDYGGSSDTDYGALVRAEMPNAPKRGQLDFTDPSLHAPVPLDGLKTVGDLIYRIGNLTKIEIYVDPRMEKKSLTLLGATSAPASDLLRSLAFCLTSTFRKVGPAYVLTDDIAGLGARKQIWNDFEEEADVLRRGPVRAASNALYVRHTPRDIPWLDDPAAVTPEQIKLASDQTVNTQDGFSPELKLTLSQLTPVQQDMVRRGAEKWNREYKRQPVSTDGNIRIRPALNVQLLSPGVDTPIDMNLNHGGMEQCFLFQEPADMVAESIKAQDEKRLKEHPEWRSLNKTPEMGPMADTWNALRAAPRRAVIVHARNAKEVDAACDAAKTLGLNELWLDVFSGGKARTDLASHGENDILTEALARTKGTPIQVYPMLALMYWGDSPPEGCADRNILGETSAQAAARRRELKALLTDRDSLGDEAYSNPIIPDWPGVIVCPLAPAVRATLTGLIKDLAARRGIGGMVWRDLDSPGYDLLPGGSDTNSLLLGYHEAARLAFLRRFHADPVDIYDVGHDGVKANTDLPNFGDNNGEYQLHDSWVKFRQEAFPAFLRELYVAANPTGTPPARRIPMILKQLRRGQGGNIGNGQYVYPPGWYGSWDNPALPPPTLHTQGEEYKPGEPSKPVAGDSDQARLQSHIVITPLTRDTLSQMRMMASFRKSANPAIIRTMPSPPAMSGFVLDLGDAPGVGALNDLLTEVKSVPPPASVAKPAAK